MMLKRCALLHMLAGSVVLFSSFATAQIMPPAGGTKPPVGAPGDTSTKPYCVIDKNTTTMLPSFQGAVGETMKVTDPVNGRYSGCQAYIQFSDGKIALAQTTELTVNELVFKIPTGVSGPANLFFIRVLGGTTPPSPTAVQGTPFAMNIVAPPPVVTAVVTPNPAAGQPITFQTQAIQPGDSFSATFVFPQLNNLTLPAGAVTFLSNTSFSVVAPDPAQGNAGFWNATPVVVAQVILRRGSSPSNALSFVLGRPTVAPTPPATPRKPSISLPRSPGQLEIGGVTLYYVGRPDCETRHKSIHPSIELHQDEEEFFCCERIAGSGGKCGPQERMNQSVPDCDAYREVPGVELVKRYGCYRR